MIGYTHIKKLDSYLTTQIKLSCKYNKFLNVKAKTLNKKCKWISSDLETGKSYLNMTQKAQPIRENMDKFNYIKIKNIQSKRHFKQVH